MGEVVEFTGYTSLPIEPEKVLKGAIEQNLTEVIIVGYTNKNELYMASSSAYKKDVLWAIESAKQILLSQP